jgi:hypothetical protein
VLRGFSDIPPKLQAITADPAMRIPSGILDFMRLPKAGSVGPLEKFSRINAAKASLKMAGARRISMTGLKPACRTSGEKRGSEDTCSPTDHAAKAINPKTTILVRRFKGDHV